MSDLVMSVNLIRSDIYISGSQLLINLCSFISPMLCKVSGRLCNKTIFKLLLLEKKNIELFLAIPPGKFLVSSPIYKCLLNFSLSWGNVLYSSV